MGTFLIIGASSGIGKATSELLIAQGNTVIGTYTTQKPEATQGITYHQLNVLDPKLDLSFLPETLDGIIYCPGSINLLPFARIKPQDFLEDYKLQVVGAITIIQGALKALKKGTYPAIVLFSTVAVQQGFNFHSQVAASKGAIEGLTKSLAAELSPTIRVNCIAPSITNTPLASKLLGSDAKKEANANRHPLKTIGEPEYIAQTAAFLISDKARWITGQIIGVDGGMSTLKV